MGKLVLQTNVKWDGDLFNLFLFPYQFSQIMPQTIHSCDLLAGSWGNVGCVVHWTYNLGGAKSTAKEMIEAIDEKKKSITYKVIEGDPLKLYSEFKTICEIKSNGEDNTVTYTFEYEKRSDQVAEPTMYMDFLLHFTKEINECSRQLVPN